MGTHVSPFNEAPGRQSRRWGVLLAGGDGARLRKLTNPERVLAALRAAGLQPP